MKDSYWNRFKMFLCGIVGHIPHDDVRMFENKERSECLFCRKQITLNKNGDWE